MGLRAHHETHNFSFCIEDNLGEGLGYVGVGFAGLLLSEGCGLHDVVRFD